MVTFLDCTLRDGGYYTRWDFDRKLVNRYLEACNNAGVDYVEIGMRNTAKEGFFGPYAFSTETFLSKLDIPSGLKIGVMIDAKNVLNDSMGVREYIGQIFCDQKKSYVTLVRIAAHFNELQDCGPIVCNLKQLGYTVGVNLMQAGGKSSEEVKEKISALLSAEFLPDVIYFADSLGNMDPQEVGRLYSAIEKAWMGPIGIHTHNNMGLATHNAIKAQEAGVTWIDATIQGMGRGAGNAEMEILLSRIGSIHGKSAEALYPIAMDEFAALRDQYKWGPNLLYHYSAIHEIHPTYAQTLLSEGRYSHIQQIEIMKHLSNARSTTYNESLIGQAVAQKFVEEAGSWCAKGIFDDEEIVLVASGKSCERYAEDIVEFSNSRKCKMFTINVNKHIPAEAIEGVITVDEDRIRFESRMLRAMGKAVYAPLSSFEEGVAAELRGLKICDYGLSISKSEVTIGETFCKLTRPLSALYALAIFSVAGARRIYLAGFDGYEHGDPRQVEMVDALGSMLDASGLSQNIVAITPTTYNIPQRSLYEPR